MITVTCNPEWPEIVANLEPHQTATDRQDLCCRVFHVKLAKIMADLKGGKVFGEYDYHMYVIEFQKRGLPHSHILIKFKGDGPDTRNEMDKWVLVHRPCGGPA